MMKQAIASRSFGSRVLIVDIQDEYGEAGAVKVTLDEAIKNAPGRKTFCWRIHEHRADQVNDIFRLAMALGNVTVIADECSFYSDSEWFVNAIMAGRGRGVQVVAMSQRAYRTDVTVRSQCAAVVAFYTEEPRDIGYIRERCGPSGEKEMRAVKNAPGHFAGFGKVELIERYFKIKKVAPPRSSAKQEV